ncbi:hypothetical protein F4703DRAFT_1939849 [Phycomyces blakesleeanus]
MSNSTSTESSTAVAKRRLEAISNQVSPLGSSTFDTASYNEQLRIHRKPNQAVHSTALTPLRFLLRSAMVHGTKTAIIHRSRSYNYQIFADRIRRLASVLINDYNVQKGDRVGVLCNNIPAALEGNYAIPFSGAILVPLNTRLATKELDYILDHSGVSVLIVQEELFEKLSEEAKAKIKLILVSDSEDFRSDPFEQLLERCTNPFSWNQLHLPEDENSVISINYTSGSTGRPKGVMVTHKGSYLHALTVAIQNRLTTESIYMWTLPLFHCNGWGYPWSVVMVGGTQVMLNKLDYEYIWKLLIETGVTHYAGAPTVQNEICNHRNARRLPQEVRVVSGGSALSSTLVKRMTALNLQPLQVYGLTEVYGPSVMSYDISALENIPEEERNSRLARQGFNTVVTDELRILNHDTIQDVAPNGKEIGEICITGNTTMIGYYRDPVETEKAFKHGVFWTGDLAVRHVDGSIEIVDRSKDVIVSGGENVSSIEVESAIVQMEEVSECAIVASPDPKWGERPFAFVILRENAKLDPKDVISHCKNVLAGYKCPEGVRFVNSLPRTSLR